MVDFLHPDIQKAFQRFIFIAQLNDPYGQQQRFHSYNHNNNLMVPNQSPVHHHTLPYPDQQTVRYSTICRQGRIPPSHSYQGPSPVR